LKNKSDPSIGERALKIDHKLTVRKDSGEIAASGDKEPNTPDIIVSSEIQASKLVSASGADEFHSAGTNDNG